MDRTGFEFGASRLQAQCSHCLAMSYPCIACLQTPLPSGKIREGTPLQFFLRGGGSVHKLSFVGHHICIGSFPP